jgi:hypothetical protein
MRILRTKSKLTLRHRQWINLRPTTKMSSTLTMAWMKMSTKTQRSNQPPHSLSRYKDKLSGCWESDNILRSLKNRRSLTLRAGTSVISSAAVARNRTVTSPLLQPLKDTRPKPQRSRLSNPYLATPQTPSPMNRLYHSGES